MNATVKRYAVDLLFVLIAIGIINTIQKRVPVIGPIVGQVAAGL